MEKLCMADTLKHNGDWINPSSKMSDEIDDEKILTLSQIWKTFMKV